jgi:23S rRNA (uracil1939-C5)-methyltransferase
VPIDRCPVLAPELAGTIEAARGLAEPLRTEGNPLDIQVTASEPGLDVDVRGSGPLRPELIARLARVAQAHRLARLTRHGELIAQNAAPTVHMGRANVVLSPGAFLQATAQGEATLARLVAAHAGAAETIADLFAGLGPFALRLAEGARMTAADSNAAALAALSQAAAATAGLRPVETQVRDLYRRPLAGPELARFDAVIFDPPRQGARRRPARSPNHKCRPSSRSLAIRRPSRATPSCSSAAAIASPPSRRSTNSATRRTSRSSRALRADQSPPSYLNETLTFAR